MTRQQNTPSAGESRFDTEAQRTACLCLLCVLCVRAAVAKADFVTDGFGVANCSRAGTMSVRSDEQLGRVLKFDLSSIPRGATVYRAVLKVSVDRGRNYSRPVLFYPVVLRGGKPARAERPLPLRGPFYQDFDATAVVRKWVAQPEANLGLVVASAPRWRREATVLLVSYEGRARPPAPAVSGLEAAFVNGQVFLRWREIEDVIAAEEVPFGQFEAKVLAARKKRSVFYRVYRHTEPITARNIGQAELMREVPAVLPAYNLDAVPTTEFPGGNSRPSRLIGGNRRIDLPVRRFRVPMSRQLRSGENLAVLTARRPGRFYYAVTAVVNGREAVGKLSGGNSLAEPVEEKVQPVAPLLQEKKLIKRGRREEVFERYVCFYEPPYWPTPIRVEMCSAYEVSTARKEKAPLEICTGTYGGQSPYNLRRRHVSGAYYVAPPVMLAMGQGVHECIGTLKTYDDGLVRNYPHRQIFALIAWAQKKWPNIDPQRVIINGQFALWALRHGEKFAMVIADPYGNFAAGKEMVRWGWAWGPFPRGRPNEDGGVDQWEYLNLAGWIRRNPAVELPFYVGKPSSASHVGDMGFLPAPELYKALLDTKRAFAAHYGPSQGFGGPPRAFPGMPIRTGQALPAFSNCSLDDMIGEGDQWGGAAGGTIGSGDPWGRFNADLRWGFDDIVDEPRRFAVTVWLAGSARKDECTVDLTPRRCRKFRLEPGQRFRWAVAAPEAGGVLQSGAGKADKWGLATVEKLIVAKQKRRVTIEAR